MKVYPEIKCLQQYFKKQNITIKKCAGSAPNDFVLVAFCIGTKSWTVLVDDEYDYFSEDNQLMCLYLTLSSLEAYKESTDYLLWCKQNGFDASDLNWLAYYNSLETTFFEIKEVLGKIDPCISPYDLSLRTDVIDYLAKGNF